MDTYSTKEQELLVYIAKFSSPSVKEEIEFQVNQLYNSSTYPSSNSFI